ncbi:unnamed protein product [Paramecium octaurelia]|uniref:Uncharacterized protein n=1 Tax=Paramecium octaurelia TaxID=43137 RepID=A0A8S1SQE8_PAROT|nr:unnamed protein product [Paramecium octaurelia]
MYTYVAKNDGNLDGWLIYNSQSPFTTSCGGIAMLGGINSFNENTVIKRIFSNLKPHYQLRLEFRIWIIDSSSITDIEVQLDQEDYAESVVSFVIEESNYCGLSNKNENIKQVSFALEHNFVQATVFAKFKFHDDNRIQWGMQYMLLSLDFCSSQCLYCTGPLESDCQTWSNIFYQFSLDLFSNRIIFDSQLIEFSYYYECQKCDLILNLDLVQTTTTTPILKQNFAINDEIVLKLYNNGTFIILLIQQYGLAEFNLRLYSRWEVGVIQTLIQYQVSYHLQEFFFPFIPGCQDYFYKECVQCLQGWELNIMEQVCYPSCGNNYIEGYEECDDGNFIPYDGCFECKYQCIQYCEECNYGICEKCEFGFTYDEERKICLNECGQFCLICFNLNCTLCQKGFYQRNGACNPICGDKIVLQDIEECDDGNNKNNECHGCKLVCEEGCDICEKGICQLNCLTTFGIGFYYIDENCKSVCGDSIVTVVEECDDGNDIEFDGCFKCNYSCEQNCLDCQNGRCLKFQSDCGDAKLQEQEECDDGNKDTLDGCFNCAVEPGWKCIQIQQNTFCNSINPPQFISKFLSIQNNKQLVLFQFSQEIKVVKGCNLTESMVLNILNISNTQYILTWIEKKEPLEEKVQESYYIIQIEINTQTQSKPVLSIDLNATILNNDNEEMQKLQYELQLEVSQYLSPKQKQQSNQIKDLNSYFIYGQIAIGVFFFIIGQPDILLQMLDILQYFSYLRYMAVSFPLNLEIFFQISDQISFSLIYQFINFEEIINQIMPQNYMSPQFGKFLLYDQNADLLSNIIPQMIQCLMFLLYIIFRSLLYRILYWIMMNIKFFICLTFLKFKFNSRSMMKTYQQLRKLSRQLIKVRQYFNSQQITNFMIINGWDLIFKSFLYLRSFENYSNRNLISLALASFILAIYGCIILNLLSIRSSILMRTQKNQYLGERFEAFDLIKQIVLLYAFIFIYKSEIIQIAILIANCLIQIAIILNSRSHMQLQNFISIILQEGSIFLFILISLVYTKDFTIYLSVENKFIIGWIHIFLLSFILALPIIECFKDLFYWIYKKTSTNERTKHILHQIFLN